MTLIILALIYDIKSLAWAYDNSSALTEDMM